MPETLLLVAIVAIGVLVAASLVARWTRVVTVYEYERGLRFRNGRLTGEVEPGRYVMFGPATVIVRVDTRPLFTTVPNQEVLTADGITVKVTAAIGYRVVDVRRAIIDVASYRDTLYLAAQVAVRHAIASRTIDAVLTQRDPIGAEVLAEMQPEAATLGLEVTRAELKDVMLPGDLKRIFAQVLEAQKAGQAALERARGETAALRSLANAARIADASPSLMTLRALQGLEQARGNTLVLGVPVGSVSTPGVQAPATEPGVSDRPVTTPRRGGGGPGATARRGDAPPGT